MRLDEGMVTHGEKCDSRGLKMSEIYLPMGPEKITSFSRLTMCLAIVFTNSVGFGRWVSACGRLLKRFVEQKQENADFVIYTNTSMMCFVRGRRASDGVAVTLSLCLNGKRLVFQLTGPDTSCV